jgi:hypothetical protein
MKRSLGLLVALSFFSASLPAQEGSPAAATETSPAAPAPAPVPPAATPAAPKRGFFGRVMHPFGGGGDKAPEAPKYKDAKLRGLVVSVEVSPQTVKLSEVRQLDIKATLTNTGKKSIELNFPNDQRIEIYLLNGGDVVLTKWSDNHAITEKPGSVLMNPGEHIEYNEKIATRDLARDKVFVAEVFFPAYPELRGRQKFLTAP